MTKVNYKYIKHGEKFTFEGKEYTKGSHDRGRYIEDGKTINKNFKKWAVVETDTNFWDVVPKLKG